MVIIAFLQESRYVCAGTKFILIKGMNYIFLSYSIMWQNNAFSSLTCLFVLWILYNLCTLSTTVLFSFMLYLSLSHEHIQIFPEKTYGSEPVITMPYFLEQ